MPAIIITILWALGPIFTSFFKWVQNYSKIIFDFLLFALPQILKWGFVICLIFFSSSLLIFTVYHVVYGSAYWLSWIATTQTINIMIYSTYWFLIYSIYFFLYKN